MIENESMASKYRQLSNVLFVEGIKSFSAYNQLNHLVIDDPMARLIYIFLTDCCDQIHILGGYERVNQYKSCINLKGITAKVDEFHTNDPIYDIETAETFLKAYNKKKIKKLTDDSIFVKDVLTLLKMEIKNDNNYTILSDLLNEMKEIQFAESSLLANKINNLQNMYNLKKTLNNDEKESLLKLQQLDTEMTEMRDITEDICFVNIIRTRYISKWEGARTAQNATVHHQAENELRHIISKHKTEIEKEQRITMEITEFLDKNQKEIAASIDYWAGLYDKELERREIEMQILKEKREVQENDFLELKGVFALHKQQIEEYLTYKEKKRIEAERKAFLDAKATKIQAWWRGLMVRLQLGPFNPNPKKKRRKKKDKNEKTDKKSKKK